MAASAMPLWDTSAPLGVRHFVPQDTGQLYSAIFTWWNVLDGLMYHHAPRYRWQAGYIRVNQMERMIDLIRRPGVKSYCELGMNGGHSVAAMLQANPEITAHVFDIMMFNYSLPAATLLQAAFGERFVLHAGNTRLTVRPWAKSFVDAGQ